MTGEIRRLIADQFQNVVTRQIRGPSVIIGDHRTDRRRDPVEARCLGRVEALRLKYWPVDLVPRSEVRPLDKDQSRRMAVRNSPGRKTPSKITAPR